MPQFTPIEMATIRNAVADQAGGLFGGPLGFTKDDTARYVSEGYLSKLVDKYSLRDVWEAVAEVIHADESVLTRTPAERKQGAADRTARCVELEDAALAAYKASELDRALALVDQAELIDPAHRIGGRHDWADVRGFLTRRLPSQA
jgi:hypothetical protein